MKILGIETSCDETAASIVEDGKTILSSVVWSQTCVHRPYGGVVPELASRKHIEKIVPVTSEALQIAGLKVENLDGVAVTRGPGLVGALLVGFSFARALCYAHRLPMIGVDHLEGHISAIYLTPDPPAFPFVALVASGGHTNLVHVYGPNRFELMGQTRDDAAGEAFDKVAKLLGLGYPGGEAIEQLATRGNPDAIKFPRAWLDKQGFDFSFSGVKTAVARYVLDRANDAGYCIEDVAASFQEAVVDVLVQKALLAARIKGCAHLVTVGGVACNGHLRLRIEQEARRSGICVHIPPTKLCSDNAAMIAAAGFFSFSGKGPTHDDRDGTSLDCDVYSRKATEH